MLDLFLPAFDEGYLTDARGRKTGCKQMVFIMTSNLGAADLQVGQWDYHRVFELKTPRIR